MPKTQNKEFIDTLFTHIQAWTQELRSMIHTVKVLYVTIHPLYSVHIFTFSTYSMSLFFFHSSSSFFFRTHSCINTSLHTVILHSAHVSQCCILKLVFIFSSPSRKSKGGLYQQREHSSKNITIPMRMTAHFAFVCVCVPPPIILTVDSFLLLQ